MLAKRLELGEKVIAHIDGREQRGESRGWSYSDGDIYDVMTENRKIHCGIRHEQVQKLAVAAPASSLSPGW